jgi:hypothetical protein
MDYLIQVTQYIPLWQRGTEGDFKIALAKPFKIKKSMLFYKSPPNPPLPKGGM